jgi:hypothetical protein
VSTMPGPFAGSMANAKRKAFRSRQATASDALMNSIERGARTAFKRPGERRWPCPGTGHPTWEHVCRDRQRVKGLVPAVAAACAGCAHNEEGRS